MKGLLYKDFVLFKKAFWTLLGVGAFILIVFCFGIAEMNTAFGVPSPEDALSIVAANTAGYFCFFILLTPLSSGLFTPDEKPTTVGFLFSTPQAAKGQIQSKYYFLLILNLGILLLCFVTDTIIMGRVGENASSASLACMLFFCMNLILLAIRIPFNVRFGSAMSFPVQIAGIILITSGILLYALFGDISFFFSLTEDYTLLDAIIEYLSSEKVVFALSLIPYISVAMYYLSYRISLALYRKGVETYEQ